MLEWSSPEWGFGCGRLRRQFHRGYGRSLSHESPQEMLRELCVGNLASTGLQITLEHLHLLSVFRADQGSMHVVLLKQDERLVDVEESRGLGKAIPDMA
jgi:hypothetical protein